MRILRPAIWLLTSILCGILSYFWLLVLLRGEIIYTYDVCITSRSTMWLIFALALVISLTIFGLYGSVKELRKARKQ